MDLRCPPKRDAPPSRGAQLAPAERACTADNIQVVRRADNRDYVEIVVVGTRFAALYVGGVGGYS